jgi:hypothetical protein
VNIEDLTATGLVGNPDDDLPVEPAGAAKRLVDRFGPVGGCDDDRVLARVTWPRLGAIESISSMKMIDGAAWAAWSKISRSRRSLSP